MTQTPFQRNTRQRQVILEELCKLDSHPTASHLYDIVRRRLPNISLGTVYRNLDRLTRQGTIQKLEVSGTESRFDGNPHGHDHLRCICCGRVDDVVGAPLDLSGGGSHDFRGYEVLGHRLELLGKCPRCRQRPAPNHPTPL
jgi:Fur family transcriptional regulator, ferric uptake regulator